MRTVPHMALNAYVSAAKGKAAFRGGTIQKGSDAPKKTAAPPPPEKKPAVAKDTFEAKKAPRDAASGLATGRRQHKPLTLTMELGRVAPQPAPAQPTGKPPSEPASGQATGKRAHKPIETRSATVTSPRDPASGLPTGKRMHKPMSISVEIDKTQPL